MNADERRSDERDGQEFKRILASLHVKAKRAAGQNKPVMWAYYLRMAGRLWQELGQAAPGGGIAGAALAVTQRADDDCPHLPRDEAADLWALSVYCRRIMRAWGVHPNQKHTRPDLSWLRNRSNNMPPIC